MPDREVRTRVTESTPSDAWFVSQEIATRDEFEIKRNKAYGGCLGTREAMKAVVSCDKPGGAAHSCDPGMAEWGNPAGREARHRASESEPGELKHLSTRRKRNQPRCP